MEDKPDYQKIAQQAQENQESLIESGQLSMCPKCERPYPPKWGSCPDCKTVKQVNYAEDASDIDIPTKYVKAYEGAFTDSESSLIEDFSAGKIEGVFLHGNQGTGKTYLATALLHEYVARLDANGCWMTVGSMLAAIRGTYSQNVGISESQVMEKYIKIPALLLDDLGAEKTTEWTVSTMREIIAGRIDWCRPTIVTSNLSLAEIDKWNPRVASRLGGLEVIEMTGTDRRLA